MSSDYQVNAYRNVRLAYQLLRVMEALEGEGIDCLAYKGPALAVQAYGDLSVREFCDLDLLIHPEDFPRTYNLLVQNGFQPVSVLPGWACSLWPRVAKEFSFTFQGICLEVHTCVADPGELRPLSPEIFWEDPQEVEVLGRPVRTLASRRALLAACLHGFHHGWSQSKWVRDVAQLCQACTGLDWSALLEEAQRSGFSRLVGASLLLAENPGEAQLPAQVAGRLRGDPAAVEMADLFRRNLSRPFLPIRTTSYNPLYVRARERLEDRVRHVVTMFFAPHASDFLAFPLPGWLFPLYTVLRPARLVWVFGVRRLVWLRTRA